MGFSEDELKAMMDRVRERKRQRTGPMVVDEVKSRRPRKGPGMTESGIQRRCVSWFDKAYPSQSDGLFAIPNSGGFKGGFKSNLGIVARMKAEGVRKGIPDLMIAIPKGQHHGLFIEMKREDGGRVSDDQKKKIAFLASQGYKVEVIRSEEAFKDAVREYMNQEPPNKFKP